jgi:NIMA (never in mitosis gene a)-related kinase
VEEFADAGDLYNKIQAQKLAKQYISEVELWNIFLGIAAALNALHSYKILHRDLKTANVFLFKDGRVKLGDFNVSKVARRGALMATQTGTPYYASPEVWQDHSYDEKSDMWSFGCVIFETATLRPPFRADDMESLYRKVLRGLYPRIPACYSQQVADVIAWLLRVNPRERPTVLELLSRLNLDIHALAPKGRTSLLKTIRLPKDPKDLHKLLPPARYGGSRTLI